MGQQQSTQTQTVRPIPKFVASFSKIAQFDRNYNPKLLLNPRILSIEKELGKGGFGAVYQVSDLSGQKYALKILLVKDPNILNHEIGSLSELSKFPRCMSDVVCYYDAFQFQFDTGEMAYGILTELVEGKNLDEYMISQGGGLSVDTVADIGIWLTQVLGKLHSLGYVHRDIKPQNIMIEMNMGIPSPRPKYRLIDFGLSCFLNSKLQKSNVECSSNISGTPNFFAPELLNGNFMSNIDKYYQTADVFSAGVTLYYLLTGKYPYNLLVPEMMYDPSSFQPLNSGNRCFDQIVNSMITLNPDLRPRMSTIPEIIRHCIQ
jgi:protein phosphatase